MKTYKYQAISKDGVKVSGVIEGFNDLDAAERIKETHDIVVKLTEVKESDSEIAAILNTNIGEKKIDIKAMAIMCSQFSILIRSGINIVRAVELVANQCSDEKLKKILKEVHDDVQAGRHLSTGLEERGGKLFPVLFIETIRAGEESANLEVAFDSMYRHFDKMSKNNSKVKSAMSYPIFVLVIAIVVVIVLMAKVVPTFTSIFDSYGAQLPLITRILIAISDFFREWWILLLVAIVAVVGGIKLYGMTEKGKYNLSKLSLKIPILGNIQKLNAASQFANNFGTLIRAGISINEALPIVARIIENYYISKEVGKWNSKIESGFNLGTTMRESGVMPEMLDDMVSVGEETGMFEETLATVAEYYDNELDQEVKSALAKLEPTMLLVIAGIGGFIVVAIYMAMFQMYGVM